MKQARKKNQPKFLTIFDYTSPITGKRYSLQADPSAYKIATWLQYIIVYTTIPIVIILNEVRILLRRMRIMK